MLSIGHRESRTPNFYYFGPVDRVTENGGRRHDGLFPHFCVRACAQLPARAYITFTLIAIVHCFHQSASVYHNLRFRVRCTVCPKTRATALFRNELPTVSQLPIKYCPDRRTYTLGGLLEPRGSGPAVQGSDDKIATEASFEQTDRTRLKALNVKITLSFW